MIREFTDRKSVKKMHIELTERIIGGVMHPHRGIGWKYQLLLYAACDLLIEGSIKEYKILNHISYITHIM